MADISNRTLAALMVVAIAVSLIGMIGALRFEGIKLEITELTGAQTVDNATTGTASINITDELIINVTTNVDFGTGRLNDSIDWCSMNETGTALCQVTGGSVEDNHCTFSNNCGLGSPGMFIVKNIGTVNDLNISINSSKAEKFLGDANDKLQGGGAVPDAYYQWTNTDPSTKCEPVFYAEKTYYNFNNTLQLACGDLDVSDEFNVSVRINITKLVAGGVKTQTVAFLAERG
ncbi:hypothetical protein ACFL0W_06360 [Nanoarchaeota archaeon]